MLFVKASELKVGMRLARPIYNKNGVLLYERNSKLTTQGITSINNFGLIGIFILEPAEPVPPMTKDDIEFERFQTMTVFAIQDELNSISQNSKAPKTQIILGNIIKNYGHLNRKINLIQSLRSKEDYVFKHTLNVAIMCALMTHVLNMKVEDQLEVMIAALSHDVGKLNLEKDVLDEAEISDKAKNAMRAAEIKGYDVIDNVFSSYSGVKRMCIQAMKMQVQAEKNEEGDSAQGKVVRGAKVLAIANVYDEMTAMKFGAEPKSEVAAIRYLLEHKDIFGEEEVQALIGSINILAPGTSVELNSGEKGLVLTSNEYDILRPMVLTFSSNSIIDLSNSVYSDMHIVDIMKTLDNRYIMDTSLLKKSGIQVEEPEYVEVPGDDDIVETPIFI
ncbi:MAG: HD domain-containing protein [Lachnospiraceae bacterium]|nr:HD domain-containing protein [Candidatus Merdinaster equi]